MRLVVAGAPAGLVFGYVLMRSNLCFHSAMRGLLSGRFSLAKAWALGISIAAVGLTIIYSVSPWDNLNQGLPLRPVGNLGGGLLFGIGMVVAASCASGLFYKLGSGMLGAAVGIAGWTAGQLMAERIQVPGPTLLPAGEAATLSGWLGVPRAAVTLPLAAVVIFLLMRSGKQESEGRQWGWPLAGTALGIATIIGWVLAGTGGASFGPSTIGAVTAASAGRPNWWLTAFLIALVPGATIAARTSGGWWVRSETGARYVQLALGGLLIGAGGLIAGGCNLGHGVSGAAQLSISSFVAVAGMIGGVALAAAVRERIADPLRDWRPSAPPA